MHSVPCAFATCMIVGQSLFGNPAFHLRTIKQGDTLGGICNGKAERIEFVARINGVSPRALRPGRSIFLPNDWSIISAFSPFPVTVDSIAARPQVTIIDLSEEFLGGYEFGRLVQYCRITCGKPGFDTPTGRFSVRWKDVDHVSNLFFDSRGRPLPMHYGVNIGGTHWIHEGYMPGYAESHGCIRLRTEDAQWYYQWAIRGSPVFIRQ